MVDKEMIKPVAEWCAALIEAAGIAVIGFAAVYVLAIAAYQIFRHRAGEDIFRKLRMHLGRGILLGLEFLVAADIIRTVAVELTVRTVGILAAIVGIRTFLSFTLEVELTGNWPWNKNSSENNPDKDKKADGKLG